MSRIARFAGLLLLVLLTLAAGWIVGKIGIGSGIDPVTLPEKERRFADKMQNVSMVGYFTVDGREQRASVPDRYDIFSVQKVGEDRWRFNARIGEVGLTLPVTVTMRWVDDTPVILLTDLTVPFARLLLRRSLCRNVAAWNGWRAYVWAHRTVRESAVSVGVRSV